MNSLARVQLGTIQLDPQAKTLTVETEGVNAEGGKTTGEAVFTRKGSDTVTFQRRALTGSIVEGPSPSPVYTLKRVKRTRGKKAAK